MTAFRESVEAMIPALRRYARALTRDADVADDLVQDTLVRALRSERLFLGGDVRSWLYTILTNLNKNRRRSLARRPQFMPLLDNNPDASGTEAESRDIARALATLVEEQRAVLRESERRYQELFRSHNVVAVAAPTVPVLPQILTPGGSTDFETSEIRGKTLDRAALIIAQSVIAPRYGAPGLSVPMGLADGLPVGLELDGLPGQDSQLLGVGKAVETVLGPLPPPRLSWHS